MPKGFNSRPKAVNDFINQLNILILYALIMHDDHDIDQRF